jgi:enterochelin esterase-like enzyme
VPYIESHYRVLTDKSNRSLAGFSMGGGGSVVYGVHHPEKFNMVYAMSSYLRRQPSTINHQRSTINHQPSTIIHHPSFIA